MRILRTYDEEWGGRQGANTSPPPPPTLIPNPTSNTVGNFGQKGCGRENVLAVKKGGLATKTQTEETGEGSRKEGRKVTFTERDKGEPGRSRVLVENAAGGVN